MVLIYKYINNEKGQSVVELAILLPILLLILMGIFEFGRVMNAQLIITQVSREGARSASVGGSDTEIIQTINESISSLDSSKLTIKITPSQGSRVRGTTVVVETIYRMDIVIPIIENIIPDPMNLRAQTTMRVE